MSNIGGDKEGTDGATRLPVGPVGLALTATDVRKALRDYYPAGQYALLFEVGNAVGHGTSRHIDAIAMGTWPSRGLTVTAIEIKVSRSDWRREVENPAKAESIAKFCDYFYVAAPAGVVPRDTVPENWGLLEVKDGKARQTKAAVKNDAPEPLNRFFVAAVLRSAHKQDDAEIAERVKAETAAIAVRLREEIQSSVKRQNSEAARQMAALHKAFDDAHLRYIDDESFANAVAFVLKTGVFDAYVGIGAMAKRAEDFAKSVRALIAKDAGNTVAEGRPAGPSDQNNPTISGIRESV